MVLLKFTALPQIFMLFVWAGMAVVSRWAKIRTDRKLHDQLMREFHYYRGLAGHQQRHFRDRVRAVAADKEFVGRGIEVTRQMEYMLSASVVQITFGLSLTTLAHFSRIIVYPGRYRSRISKVDHVGEVNPGLRAIVISWDQFYRDYGITNDGRNLGLHEKAHAIWFEHRVGESGYVKLDKQLMARWRELAQEEADRMYAGKGRLFRDYASTNQEEFFAVAVEYFFERPQEFRDALPELYTLMCGLLKQDPAATIVLN